MIDFTDMPKMKKSYGGANGSKISVLYNHEMYMLKFPPLPTKNKEMSYSNSCVSEYIGCKIFKSVEIPVQDVLLGIYITPKGKEKLVVACKDFTSRDYVLQDFASLKNQIIDSEKNGYGTELADILETFQQQNAMNADLLKEHFWNVFIVDALIGNWDRHNGNWGFLYNMENDEISLASVYDCGSSLFPQADEKMIETILQDQNEINHRVFNIPLSAIMQNGKKINYHHFISSLENEDCNQALNRIYPKIDMEEINKIVEETPLIANEQKQFYKTLLSARKERILDFSYKKLQKQTMKKLSNL